MFHETLRSIRESKNITQIEMAHRTGIPVTTYRNYENTLREPSYDILIKISQVLETSVDELLGIRHKDGDYQSLFRKIKRLPPQKLQMLSQFTDFLLETK